MRNRQVSVKSQPHIVAVSVHIVPGFQHPYMVLHPPIAKGRGVSLLQYNEIIVVLCQPIHITVKQLLVLEERLFTEHP